MPGGTAERLKWQRIPADGGGNMSAVETSPQRRVGSDDLRVDGLSATGWFKTMTHPDLGSHRYNGFPWRFASRELVAASPPPRLGEHSALLLHEELGLDEAEIEALMAKDVSGAVL